MPFQVALVRSTVLSCPEVAALLAIVGATFWLVGRRTYSDTVTAARQQRSALVDLRGVLQDAETGNTATC